MESIPFDQIGPSQVGRLVYQVLGKDGPVFNPSNIRYLAPSEAGLDVAPIAGVAPALAGISGLTMVASVAAVGLSAATLRECRNIRKGIDRIDSSLGDLSDQMSRIEKRVERIDVKVAESHLREAVAHLSEKAIADDHIDLKELARLQRDLEAFFDSFSGNILFNFSVHLSSDVRDRLEEILIFLQSLRVSALIAHNGAADGDPLQVLSSDPIGDYLSCPVPSLAQFAVAIGRDDNVFFQFAEALGEKVEEQFLWAGDEENKEFREYCIENYFHPQNEAMSSTLSSMEAMLLTVAAESALPELDYGDEDAELDLEVLARTWFAESDASVLFRLWFEVRGISEGYETAFYSKVDWIRQEYESAESGEEKALLFQTSER